MTSIPEDPKRKSWEWAEAWREIGDILSGGIIRIDPNIFGGEIGGEKLERILPCSQPHSHLALGLREFLMGAALVELAGHGAAADGLVADGHADLFRINSYATSSDSGEDAAPVGIGAGPCGFYQEGMCNGAGDLQGLVAVLRLLDLKTDDVLHALAVGHDLFRQRAADFEQGRFEILCAHSSSRMRLAPEARRRTVSLVEVSPSTEMTLKVSSQAFFSELRNSAGVAITSVSTYTNMVASWGWIMPEPLAIPVTALLPERKGTLAILAARIGGQDGVGELPEMIDGGASLGDERLQLGRNFGRGKRHTDNASGGRKNLLGFGTEQSRGFGCRSRGRRAGRAVRWRSWRCRN